MHQLYEGEAGGDGGCPFCGFDEAAYQVMPYQLKPYTILNGKYLVGKVLGSGGFGITYIALDVTLERKVAIKEYFIQNGCMQRDTSQSSLITTQTEDVSLRNFMISACRSLRRKRRRWPGWRSWKVLWRCMTSSVRTIPPT